VTRPITARYQDPLDAVWLAAAARMGLRVERSGEVYASTDGRGLLLIADAASMDADDCLAQMIFHELCHSLVQGEDSFRQVDWGLDNETDQHLIREHACLRLQAALLAEYGLRRVLAPTTDHRAFYDALPAHPFAAGREPASVLARLAWRRVDRAPWGPHLRTALDATHAIVRAAAGVVGAGSTLALLDERTPVVEVYSPLTVESCLECGACCREAYTGVEIDASEPVRERHPGLVFEEDARFYLRRVPVRGGPLGGGRSRCAALGGGADDQEPFACAIYADRPRPCRELEPDSDNCREARRLVGLEL
jgi:Fe-S-cluster containining protein